MRLLLVRGNYGFNYCGRYVSTFLYCDAHVGHSVSQRKVMDTHTKLRATFALFLLLSAAIEVSSKFEGKVLN